MELIEEWGTGIRTFRVNLYRRDHLKTDKKPIKKADKESISRDRRQKIMKYVEQHGEISNRELLNLAESTKS